MSNTTKALYPGMEDDEKEIGYYNASLNSTVYQDENDDLGDGDNHRTLSVQKQKILTLIPILPLLLSLCASLTVLIHVRRAAFNSAYKRIVFALAFYDVIYTLMIFSQPLLLPKGTSSEGVPPWVWTMGNQHTCTFAGAISQISTASYWYSGMLSFYFLLTVRFGMRKDHFAKRYEPWLHLICSGYPITTAIAGAVVGAYNVLELGAHCWVKHYKCDEDKSKCLSHAVAYAFGGIPVFLVLISLVVNNLMIYAHVRRTTLRGRQQSQQRGSQDNNSSFNSVTQAQVRRVRAVAVQAFLYVGAFFSTTIFIVVVRVMEAQNYGIDMEADLFPLLVVYNTLFPLTGLFNFMIYIRPTYLRTRKLYPDCSRFLCLRQALLVDNDLPMSGSMRSTMSAHSDRMLQRSNKSNQATRGTVQNQGSFSASGNDLDLSNNDNLPANPEGSDESW